MIVEFKSKYLSLISTKDGDIIEIRTEGVNEPQKSKFSDTEEMIIVLGVLHNGHAATFSLYEKYKKPLVEAWGNETRNWIGKKFSILHINEKMEIRPLIEEKVQTR